MQLKCVIGIVALAAGCASTVPAEKMEASAATIRSAEEIGAQKVPQAALHLQLAKEQSHHAKMIIDQGGDPAQAAALLDRAQADAELARVLAREDSTRMEAQQAVDRVSTLKQQNNR